MKITLDYCKEKMERNGGGLYLSGTGITALPEGLTVSGSLYLEGCTGITALPEGLTVGGDLDLRGTGITALPEGLTVSGSLDLRGTGITSLPEGLTVGGGLYLEGCTGITALPEGLTVSGSLDLEGCTGITALPEGLTVGGGLYLSGTGITALPEGLTVGGGLYLSGTGITALPEGLTVCGGLYLRGTGITALQAKKVKKLHDGDYVEGRYLYADCTLTHIKKKKTVGKFTLFVGKIKGKNVVSDGKNYAHCNSIREGIADLLFKSAKDRGAEQYRNISLDTEMTVEEMVTMYRVITGACRQGSESFVNSIRNLKEKYTVREAIELTKGQYNSGKFAEFFWL